MASWTSKLLGMKLTVTPAWIFKSISEALPSAAAFAFERTPRQPSKREEYLQQRSENDRQNSIFAQISEINISRA